MVVLKCLMRRRTETVAKHFAMNCALLFLSEPVGIPPLMTEVLPNYGHKLVGVSIATGLKITSLVERSVKAIKCWELRFVYGNKRRGDFGRSSGGKVSGEKCVSW